VLGLGAKFPEPLRADRDTLWRFQRIKKNEGMAISMPRILLLALTLLLSAAWLQAQDQYGSQAGSSQTGTAASGQTTVQGCLQSSDGNYTLTDKSGTSYQLHGDTSKLSAHVGHEVQITGSTSGPSATNSSMGTQAGGTLQPTLTVESMKHVSKTCHSAPAR
jgi:Protein of unknown function (DUF5818)